MLPEGCYCIVAPCSYSVGCFPGSVLRVTGVTEARSVFCRDPRTLGCRISFTTCATDIALTGARGNASCQLGGNRTLRRAIPSPCANPKPQVRGKLPSEELANSTPLRSSTDQAKEDNHAQFEGIYGTPEADTRDKEAVQCVAYRWWC
jgi:hypothetical protein